MRYSSIKVAFVLFFFILIVTISPAKGTEPVPGIEKPASGQQSVSSEILLTPETLDRQNDPLVVSGDILQAFQGLRIDNFRLFAHDGKAFTVIPFQVDERDPEGEFVFTGGEIAGSDVDNGLFDYNDEVVFMAKDVGGKVSETIWSKMGSRGTEIVVTDPKDASRKGWVYLTYFPENPPSLSEKDYVDYTPGEEIVRSAYYTMGYVKGAPFYMNLSYPEEAGGNGEDFFDRIKVRLTVKAFFHLINVKKSEEDFKSNVVGWRDGPIRVMRNVENYFRILFNLSSPSIFSVNEYYERLTYTPVQVTIPFNLKWVFNSFGINDWTWFIYGDFPGLKGGKAYTDRNLEGFHFTGNHSRKEIEKIADLSRFTWGYNTKVGVGTWFPNLLLPEILYGIVTLYVVDDETFLDPPDDTPGLIGAGMEGRWKGINEDLWFMMEPGTYELSLDTYFPHPSIKINEVDEWIDIRSFPLWVEVEETQEEIIPVAASQQVQVDDGAAGKVPAEDSEEKEAEDQGFCGVLTDARERELSLHQIFFYVGSYRVTPRTFIMGRNLSKEEYLRPDFEEIKRIEHRFEEVDPLTGMKNPMVQKMIMRDGEILELLGCKPCGFSGLLQDGNKIFLWDTQIKSVEFNECSSMFSPTSKVQSTKSLGESAEN